MYTYLCGLSKVQSVKSRRNSVRKVSKQWAERSRNWGSIPGGDTDLSLHHSVETGSGANQASPPLGTGFLTCRWLQEKLSHTPSISEDKNAWNYTSSPTCVFLVCCLIKHRGNFVFLRYFYYLHLCLESNAAYGNQNISDSPQNFNDWFANSMPG